MHLAKRFSKARIENFLAICNVDNKHPYRQQIAVCYWSVDPYFHELL